MSSKDQQQMAAVWREIHEDLGGRVEVSRKLGLSDTATYRWKVVPPEYCWRIAKLTAFRWTVDDMRPDVFDPDYHD